MSGNKVVNLLNLFQMYGRYLQQKGRPMAEAYLKQENIGPEISAGIRAAFNDAGKLIDENGKALGLTDLMGMRTFI